MTHFTVTDDTSEHPERVLYASSTDAAKIEYCLIYGIPWSHSSRVCAVARANKDASFWATYDGAAEWCARRGLKGAIGDPLPTLLPIDVLDEINTHPDAFEERVKNTAYARAMAHVGE